MSVPMGCLTGFYLLTTGLSDAEALDLVRSAFAWMASYDGEIPGASAVECGKLSDDGSHCRPCGKPRPCCRF